MRRQTGYRRSMDFLKSFNLHGIQTLHGGVQGSLPLVRSPRVELYRLTIRCLSDSR
jgi:hypothetical protein